MGTHNQRNPSDSFFLLYINILLRFTKFGMTNHYVKCRKNFRLGKFWFILRNEPRVFL